jgi:hypothetical protein
MVLVNTNIKMGIFILEVGKMIEDMDLDKWDITMDLCILVIGRKANNMGKVNLSLWMAMYMKDYGNMVRCMDMEQWELLMVRKE